MIPHDVDDFIQSLGASKRNEAVCLTFLETVPWERVSHQIEFGHLKGVRLSVGSRHWCWIYPKGGKFQFYLRQPDEVAARYGSEVSVGRHTGPSSVNLAIRSHDSARTAIELANQGLADMGAGFTL